LRQYPPQRRPFSAISKAGRAPPRFDQGSIQNRFGLDSDHLTDPTEAGVDSQNAPLSAFGIAVSAELIRLRMSLRPEHGSEIRW
jgi:hypothetical protein